MDSPDRPYVKRILAWAAINGVEYVPQVLRYDYRQKGTVASALGAPYLACRWRDVGIDRFSGGNANG